MKEKIESPINSEPLELHLESKDFSVSQEEFQLYANQSKDFLMTFPQPTASDLPKYYESDNYISHTDSKQNLVDKAYQFVKRITLKQKTEQVQKLLKEDEFLLDVGCGTGDFLVECVKKKISVFGIEPNAHARKLAQQKLEKLNGIGTNIFPTLEALEKDLSKAQIKFSVITLWHVLEHIPDLNNYLRALKNLLKEDGTLIVAVPNFKSFDAAYYGKFWAAYDLPRHLWHFSQSSISDLFRNHGMEVTEIHPMIFDAFYVSILSEKYKTGKANFMNAFRVGLNSNFKAGQSKEHSSIIYVIKRVNNDFKAI